MKPIPPCTNWMQSDHYEAPAVRGSWTLRGTDAWCLDPSKDHYRCNLYYVPETKVYRISGLAELFPQHCQVPNLSSREHLRALTEELETTATTVKETPKGKAMIRHLRKHLDDLINRTAQTPPEQRVSAADTHIPNEPSIQRVTQAPAIMKTSNPTAKRHLILTKRSHKRQTRNNTPGAVPMITIETRPDIIPDSVSRNHSVTKNYTLRRSPRIIGKTPTRTVTFTQIRGPITSRARSCIISQQALNAMTMN